jgi:hypothetical protein
MTLRSTMRPMRNRLSASRYAAPWLCAIGTKNRHLAKSRRSVCGIAMLLTAMLPTGCFRTTDAVNIAATSARLRATGTCGVGGDTYCWYYFRYRLAGQGWVNGPLRATGPVNNYMAKEDVYGLNPSSTYQYQICGMGNVNATWNCKGPDGTTNTVATFTTVPHTFGIDTNQISGYPGSGDNANLSIEKAVAAGARWVGRYIVSDMDGHLPVTLAEVHRWHNRGVKVAFIWQVDKYRACSLSNDQDQWNLGASDGAAARNYMNNTLGAPTTAAVYFTVDFNVTRQAWDDNIVIRDPVNPNKGCNYALGSKRLIRAYFDGIRSQFASSRIGVYGSYGTVSGLLDDSRVTYAWQQTFLSNDQTENRAILRQYNIYPEQDGWLAAPSAGGLDFDRSNSGFISMW